jgi:hypothetical protein
LGGALLAGGTAVGGAIVLFNQIIDDSDGVR